VLGGTLGYRRSSTLEGSEFWVELPLAKSAVRPQVALPVPALQEPTSATLSGEVLLVDDNSVNRMIGKLTLERAGMQVTTSVSAREAIELCSQRRFSVILMDILMPEMSGLECSSLLRNQPGLNRDTPIIAWSAHCSREDMLRYTAHGINDWVIKPPQPAVLTGLIRKWQHHRLDGRI